MPFRIASESFFRGIKIVYTKIKYGFIQIPQFLGSMFYFYFSVIGFEQLEILHSTPRKYTLYDIGPVLFKVYFGYIHVPKQCFG